MASIVSLVSLVARENLASPSLERRPEPTLEMNDEESVAAFHAQGGDSGPLVPVYHFNASSTALLAPRGATVVDLGSGSGQYLVYLAERRPDLKIIGLELSDRMIARAQQLFRQRGVADRVSIRQGDMTRIGDYVSEPIHVISSVFSLHHLPDISALEACLASIGQIRRTSGCSVWIFDHSRPRSRTSAEAFPEIFTPDAPRAFRDDSRNSLIASFSFEEMSQRVDGKIGTGMRHHLARLLRLYQVHASPPLSSSEVASNWAQKTLTGKALKDYQGMRWLFPGVPQQGGH